MVIKLKLGKQHRKSEILFRFFSFYHIILSYNIFITIYEQIANFHAKAHISRLLYYTFKILTTILYANLLTQVDLFKSIKI